MKPRPEWFVFILITFLLAAGISGANPSEKSESPYLSGSSWPVMRGDLQNTGQGKSGKWEPSSGGISEVRRFQTGNGIFSTPVIDDQERIYVGSADHYFYCLDPQAGKVVWKFDALELIDSAGALSKDGRVYVPAGAAIYALDLEGTKLWAFDVTNHRPEGLYTFGTNYWWEGNVALGPDQNLYAGNNDFFYYSIRPDGTLRWAHRTGFLIWSVPAFDPEDHTLYFAGFDMKVYALDMETGKLKWQKNLKNPLVASPALGPDGTLFEGSFDGKLYALASENGKIKWVAQTDSHIYGSAALDRKGRVYVTSTDGFLYALNAENGKALWTFYTGDAIRSSPALGPDPEGKEEYLIYFGGGQGEVFAIEPGGKRRWSYNTLTGSDRVDYPNINSSPALGKNGMAFANANGDVFYIPYHYYLKPGAIGITRDPTEGFRASGATWHFVSPGGLIAQDQISASSQPTPLSIHSAQVVILRLLVREQERIAHCKLIPDSIRSESSPAFSYRLEMIGDEQTLTIIPEELLKPGAEYLFKVGADYKCAQDESGEVQGFLKLRVGETKGTSPFLSGKNPGFVITHMSFPQPAIVPSLDQIGIAIMRIPFSIIRVDPEKKSFVAWAAQKYGESAGGGEQGLPVSRSLFYAFSGRVDEDFFVMNSENCFFEESSFPFPLDLFRLSGRIRQDGGVDQDATILARLDPPPMLEALGRLSVSSEEEAKGRQGWLQSALSGAGPRGFLDAALVSGPTVLQYITEKIWAPWDLYNHQGKFIATGTFRMESLPASATARPEGIKVRKFEYLKARKELVAEVEVSSPAEEKMTIGILLVDNQTGKPVPINYNIELRRQRLDPGTKRTALKIPAPKLHSGDLTAYLMADLYPLETLVLK